MTMIDAYLKRIEAVKKEKEEQNILPIITCHILYNHINEFNFLYYGYDFYVCNKYENEEEDINLIEKLNEHDIDQIARLFMLGRMDENNPSNHTGYCDAHDDSYIEAFKQRRPITDLEKRLYLMGLSSIYGTEDRMRLHNMFFTEKHSEIETMVLLADIYKENVIKIKENKENKLKIKRQ